MEAGRARDSAPSMEESLEPTVESLLEHRAWIRRLARRLVRDAEEADEIVQETWLAALRYPPPVDQPVRRWLATVLRNFARQRHRRDVMRRDVEAAREGEREDPSTARVAERLSVHRAIVDALQGLEEPLRSTLVLHYFDDLPVKRIAELQGVPAKTVYARQERALRKLRAELDRRHGGGRHACTVALLALCSEGIGRRTPALAKAAGALVVLGGVGAVALWVATPSPAPGRAAEPATVALDSTPSPRRGAARGERLPVVAAAPVEPGSTTPDVGIRTLRGRVVDPFGSPVAGELVALETGTYGMTSAGLRFEPEAPTASATRAAARTDGDGAFELAVPPETTGRLVLDSERWTAAVAARVLADAGDEPPRIVAAERRALAGLVLEATGRPCAGALVRLARPRDVFADLDLDAVLFSDLEDPWTRTDAAGRFELEAWGLDGLALSVEAPGREAHAHPLDRADFVTIELPAPPATAVRGRVLEPDGRPRSGAVVALEGREPVETDAQGTFELAGPSVAHAPPRLMAAAYGRLPVELAAEVDADRRPIWPEPLELVLGGAPLSLAGRVTAKGGEPLAGTVVWIADPTPLGGGSFPLLAESVVRGDDDYWVTFATHPDGRFGIGGLLDRDYRVCAMDPELLTIGETTVRAGPGADATIEVETGDVHGGVRGRALASDGTPIVGARVSAMRRVLVLARPDHPRPLELSYGAHVTTTASDGSFELPPFARTGTHIDVSGAGFDAHEHHLGPGDDLEALVIRVPGQARVRVDAGGSGASHFELRDERGVPLGLRPADVPAAEPVYRERIAGDELLVSEAARTLVLLRGSEVVREVDVRLVAGRSHVLP